MHSDLKLEWLPGTFAVCRFDPAPAPGNGLPEWVHRPSALASITRTDRELSIVADEAYVGDDVQAERGFVALRVVGTLDFSMVGVIASLTAALRDASVPVLVISTYDTDILLVRSSDAGRAYEALSAMATLDPPEV